VALTTVQKALGALKAEGLVVTSPMGTFVAEKQ
jgi:DNA-binding GntR family transcriptional regulator